jgi:fanconi anemia group M protein
MDVRPVAVTADSRESRSGVIDALRRMEGVTVTQAELDVADYIVGDDALGIERKSASDFLVSIMDGRLFSQLAQCTSKFEETVAILEGDIWSVRSDMSPQAIDGALCHVARGIPGVSLVYSTSVSHTARLIRLLGAHKMHGLGYTNPLRVDKPKQMELMRRYLIEGLPGIGPETAIKLLRHFQTPKRLFGATADELGSVKGIGPKTVAKLIEVLGE